MLPITHIHSPLAIFLKKLFVNSVLGVMLIFDKRLGELGEASLSRDLLLIDPQKPEI